jgi:hypothetical protein
MFNSPQIKDQGRLPRYVSPIQSLNKRALKLQCYLLAQTQPAKFDRLSGKLIGNRSGGCGGIVNLT